MGDQSTLTFEGQDETENSTNEQASFGDYDREMGQETIPPHCQIQARPVLGEQPKTLTPPKSAQESNPERTKQTGNSRKMRKITGVRDTDDEDFIAKKARNQSRKIVENDKKFTEQSDGTENDKNMFSQGETLTSSSEATGDQKETWGENNEINERLARERAISGGVPGMVMKKFKLRLVVRLVPLGCGAANRYGAGTLSHSLTIHPGPKTTKSTND
jgi:hypothetical protein